MIENPFRYGQVVTGEYFTDREKEIKEISEEIVSGQSVILISPRRYGKTSLIMNIVNKIKYPCIKIDMQLITDELDFANNFLKKVLSLNKFEKIKYFLKNLRIQPALQYNNITDEISIVFNPGERDVPIYIEDALFLPQKVAEKIKKRIIIIFDEFQEVRRISNNLEKKMRSIFQYHKNVSFVFIGSQEHMIRDIFENRNNPFYKFGKQIILRKIPDNKMTDFIIKRFSSKNMDASKMLDKIIEITNSHPYYTQQLCHEIFVMSDKKVLNNEFINKAIDNIIMNHHYDFQKWWNELDNTERKILIGICNGDKNPTSKKFISINGIKSSSTAGSAVKRLLEKGILIKKDSNLNFIEDPFWQQWILLNRK